MLDAVNYNNFQRDFINHEIKAIKGRHKKVLDFGAGIGTYADMVRTKKQPVDTVEPTAAQAKILKSKGYKNYRDINDVKEKYDVIYALNVLEHIEDDAAILAQIKERLSDRGSIVIFVPAFMLIFSGLDVKAEHYRRYRIGDMKRLAKDTGLQLSSVKYVDPVGFFGALVYRFMGANGTLSPKSVHFFDRVLFPISVFIEPVFRKILGKNVLAVFKLPD
jgi:SAM-dependent methyltransferase